MADKRQIGVRYCGGCNPRYDRVALVKRIGGFFPEAEFVTAQAGVKYPAVLVVCGCPSRCANVSDLAVPAGRLIFLSGWEELLPAKEKLAEALKGQQTRSLTHEEVLDILPHREPMLFIDTVSRLVPGEEAVGGPLPRPAGAALLRGPLPRNAGAPRRLHHRGRRPGGGHPDDDHGALRREAPPVHGGAGGHLPAENPAGGYAGNPRVPSGGEDGAGHRRLPGAGVCGGRAGGGSGAAAGLPVAQ